MKYISLLVVVVLLSFASACGSDQPVSKTTPVAASNGSATKPEAAPEVVEVPMDIANLKPEVDVAKLTDWSSCREADLESFRRQRDRGLAEFRRQRSQEVELYREYEKVRLVEAGKLKAADLSAYYSWLELKDRDDYEAMKRLRLTSPAYAHYEDVLEQHEYKRDREQREAKHRAITDAIEKVYREEGEIIDAAKQKLLQREKET
ncbi:MAG: hypothetical protein IT410_04480 [Candidatus Doudnabacteria bacterium]|nr:hypothetical protein [Candidatus Doudnabacteria bacterium]